MNNFSNVIVKNGYELMAIVKEKGDRDNPDGWYHAIIYRTKTEDYVFCSCYNIKTGSWGQGHYCSTYNNAMKAMYNYLNNWWMLD